MYVCMYVSMYVCMYVCTQWCAQLQDVIVWGEWSKKFISTHDCLSTFAADIASSR